MWFETNKKKLNFWVLDVGALNFLMDELNLSRVQMSLCLFCHSVYYEKRAFSCTLWIAAFAAPYCSACSQIIWFLFCFEKAQNFANAKSWKPSTNEDSAASKNGLNVLVNFEWESFRAAWEHQRRSKCYSSLENGCSIGGWNGSLPTHVFTSSANRHNQGEDHINHVKTHFLVRASG